MKDMNEVVLTAKEIPDLGIEAEVISPQVFANKDLKEIGNLGVYVGNREERLKKFFEIEGNSTDDVEDLRIIINGNLEKVKRIGQKMNAGEILIKGNVGMHLGSRMEGGTIRVEGNATSWVGMEMSNGRIEIEGNAGNFLGSAYRGNWKGMKGGEIVVHGNVGNNAGSCLSGGKIEIKGNAEQFLGTRMQSGLIFVHGNITSRVGAEMLNGVIIVNGKVEEMLPSFRKEGIVEKIEIPDLDFEIKNKRFLEYTGDLAENGKGKIYIKE